VVMGIRVHSGTRRRATAWLLACALACIPGIATLASAAEIENTAVVSYRLGGSTTTTLRSNTVVTSISPSPTDAQISFLRHDPGSPGGFPIAVDGGQCRTPSGSFGPLPGVVDGDGQPIDPHGATAAGTGEYVVGEAILVSVTDANRNADASVREYVEIRITTDSEDAETLRLQETGVDTGVFAGAIQGVSMPPAATHHDCVLSLVDDTRIIASYTDADYPLDTLTAEAIALEPALPGAKLRLEQQVSKQVVEIGDFLQYTLVLRNIADIPALDARIEDVLPPGLRFREGSLRVGTPSGSGAGAAQAGGGPRPATVGVAPMAPGGMLAAADPEVAPDGRGFWFPVGDLAAGAQVTATFIAEVGPGARGPTLLNLAVARASGTLTSNETDTVVRMVEAMTTSAFTIVGRVTLGECEADAEPVGIPGIRLMMEDGTFTVTDENGAYHFEGVRPGTHVVQVDEALIPPGLELASCLRNTRFAGRAGSQFVEAQGGSLMRADFRLRPTPPETSEVGVRVVIPRAGKVTLELDGGSARVSELRAIAMLPTGVDYVRGSATVDGLPAADPKSAGNAIVFDLGAPDPDWRREIAFDVRMEECTDAGSEIKALAVFAADGKTGIRTPYAPLALACGPPGYPSASKRATTVAAVVPQGSAASPHMAPAETRGILSAPEAAGEGVDWFQGQAPGCEMLFPQAGHNPRAPTLLVVLKYLPGDKVVLRLNGKEVSPLNFDGADQDAARTMTIGTWRGVGLAGGDNLLQAEITDAAGARVVIERTVRFSNSVARAELVPAQSLLVADGIRKPVVAVRMLDRTGHPVRAGVSGEYTISPPYAPAFTAGAEQGRAFLGTQGSAPTWRIEGDDGIAYIELEPTSVAGSFTLGFDFGSNSANSTRQELEGWLKSAPRDWIVVGFAKGSVGYETLSDNMQPLQRGEDGSGVRGDGQVSLYAKGRVLGKWLLTMAYDSDKDATRLGSRSLLSTIDPGTYYTLYGDGTHQGYDAASARKLYLKLEREQFYVLFGDFQSGMDGNELSRYQRTLTGMKVEYRGQLVEFNGFAANTAQSYVRDEIQGDGTSGLYRLRQRDIVLNSERIRIETRDRYHSEQILASRELVRHIDYDIDYANGTLFFREPIASRDFDFNPNWIVAEYETHGTGEEFLNGGGRIGIRAMEGRLRAGVTYLRDEDMEARSQLLGVDARFRLGEHDELRAEAATSDTDRAASDSSGNAWLLEWEHRSERLDLLAYLRRQTPGFGLGQQNRYESGMAKAGVQGQYRLDANFSLRGEVYRQEQLSSGAVRDAARVDVAYRAGEWTARAGVQLARDEAADGTVAESRQLSLGATRSFDDGRVELGAQADLSLGGKNESVDFPTRLQLSAAYRVTEAFRLLAAQEFTDGKDRDTSTTRVGFEAKPWRDATLTTTLNKSEISEYGPRTFALFGLNQRFQLNERLSFDVAVDSSQAFNQSGDEPLVVDPSQPIQAGGIRDGGALTEDFVALSGGATYRAGAWMWNARAEGRQGESNDRYGFTTAFLRQIQDGVAFSASAQAFSQHNDDGSTGLLANAQLAWAYRPPGSNWSMLNKLEFRLDEVRGGPGGSILGHATIAANGDARSSRIVNNFVLNHVSEAWQGEPDGAGVFDLYQRSQLSLYYGSKYVLDSFGPEEYSGYTDIIGAEWRFDVTPSVDIGLRASVLHSWSQDSYAWAFGPSVGFTPFENAWVSVGFNLRGFRDRDFEASHYTAEGAYLVFRLKFDQRTFGLDGVGAARGP